MVKLFQSHKKIKKFSFNSPAGVDDAGRMEEATAKEINVCNALSDIVRF